MIEVAMALFGVVIMICSLWVLVDSLLKGIQLWKKLRQVEELNRQNHNGGFYDYRKGRIVFVTVCEGEEVYPLEIGEITILFHVDENGKETTYRLIS